MVFFGFLHAVKQKRKRFRHDPNINIKHLHLTAQIYTMILNILHESFHDKKKFTFYLS